MADSFHPTDEVLGALIGAMERRTIKVPAFQRGYSWERSHVITFWSDVEDFEKNEYSKSPIKAVYFLGPIVIENRTKEIILLDGQQRLATATILIAAIRGAAETLGTAEAKTLADDIQKTYITKGKNSKSFALELGELDKVYFRQMIQEIGKPKRKATLRSNKNIATAASALRKAVDGAIAGLSDTQKVKKLESLLNSIIQAMKVVAISVNDEDEAFRIFETLNDRGLRLSAPDLLLNLLISRASTKPERSQVRDTWNEILESLGKKDAGRFLRHVWVSRYGDLKARSLFTEIKNSFKAHSISSLSFVDNCLADCENYVAIVEQTDELPDASISNVRGLIKYLGVASAIPLLLSGLECLSTPHFTEMSSKLLSLSLRYLILSDLNRDTYDNVLFELARKVRILHSTGTSSTKILNSVVLELDTLNPDDEIVKHGAVRIELQRAPALWLMTQLANKDRSKTKEFSVDKANLEHIFPQSAKVADWPNHADLTELVWNLGNLTILGDKLNRDAANKSFDVKKTNYYSKSEVKMTKALNSESLWDSGAIEKRSNRLAKEIVKLFP